MSLQYTLGMYQTLQEAMDRTDIQYNAERMAQDAYLEMTSERMDYDLAIKALLTRDSL